MLVLDDADTIRKKFKTAVTDSGREIRYAPDEKPGVSNLIEILSVASGRAIPDVEADYDGKGYGDLKTDVGEAVVELFRPMQERYAELRARRGRAASTAPNRRGKGANNVGSDSSPDVRTHGVRGPLISAPGVAQNDKGGDR